MASSFFQLQFSVTVSTERRRERRERRRAREGLTRETRAARGAGRRARGHVGRWPDGRRVAGAALLGLPENSDLRARRGAAPRPELSALVPGTRSPHAPRARGRRRGRLARRPLKPRAAPAARWSRRRSRAPSARCRRFRRLRSAARGSPPPFCKCDRCRARCPRPRRAGPGMGRGSRAGGARRSLLQCPDGDGRAGRGCREGVAPRRRASWRLAAPRAPRKPAGLRPLASPLFLLGARGAEPGRGRDAEGRPALRGAPRSTALQRPHVAVRSRAVELERRRSNVAFLFF